MSPAPSFSGQAHQLLRDDITSQRAAEKAIGLIDGIRLQNGESEFAQEHLAAIEHLGRGGAEIEGQLANRFEIHLLPEVDRKRDGCRSRGSWTSQ